MIPLSLSNFAMFSLHSRYSTVLYLERETSPCMFVSHGAVSVFVRILWWARDIECGEPRKTYFPAKKCIDDANMQR